MERGGSTSSPLVPAGSAADPPPSSPSSVSVTSSLTPSSPPPPSPLRPLISSSRSLLEDSAHRVVEGERKTVDFYNNVVVRQGNRQLQDLRGAFHHLRHFYGGQAVAASALTAAVLSAPYGRFAALRNAALVGLVTGWVVFPATVTGLMVASSEAISSSPSLPPSWKRKGEETVREGSGGWPMREEERVAGTFSRSGNSRHQDPQ